MTRTRITTLAALLLAALFLAGCGGSGGGEPTVTQTLHDELQAELDAAWRIWRRNGRPRQTKRRRGRRPKAR